MDERGEVKNARVKTKAIRVNSSPAPFFVYIFFLSLISLLQKLLSLPFDSGIILEEEKIYVLHTKEKILFSTLM